MIPPECPEGEHCLRTLENQPRLEAGETVDLYVYNDDGELHEIFVTTEEAADPERSNTSTEGFLAQAGPITENRSASGGNFTVPEDAEALYIWCWIDDHEAQGEHLVMQVDPPHAAGSEDRLTLGIVVAGALILVVGLWVLRLRGSP